MRTQSVICRGQARTIEDAVETWKAAHDDAMEVRALEGVLRICVMLAETLKGWQAETWEGLFSNKLRDTQLCGGLLRKAYAHAAAAFEGTAEWLAWAKGAGHEVDGAEQFAEAVASVASLQADLLKRWPFLTLADLAEGLEQAARGEFMSAEELERELQG